MKFNSRYAFYLIPPYQIARDIAETHLMLENLYRISAVGRFQVHCTIKGFFKPDEKSLNKLIRDLDAFLITQKPFIARDCDFNEVDSKTQFKGHITLAFKDLLYEICPEIFDWLRSTRLPKRKFQAEKFHLLEIMSQDWNGNWWETISWKMFKSWRLNS